MNNHIPFKPGDQVVAYFRDSGGDKQELSVPRQESEFLRWCNENGLIPGHIFKDEARPGSSIVSRQAFQEMMHYFRSGSIPETGLVIWNYQRFAREIDDSQFFRADIRRRGYHFHSLNDDVPEGPLGRVYEALLDWKNEQFLLDLAADVRSGLRELVERHGEIPGTPPRGFIRQPVQISTYRDGRPRIAHRWAPDMAMVPAIRLAFDMFLAGESLAAIQDATHLYRSKNCYKTFFANPIYKGTLLFGDLVIENYCEPVVDPSIWDAAQVILSRRAQRKHMSGDNPDHPRRNGTVYLLSGLAYCARCGSPLSGLTAYSHARDYRYERYSCSRQKRNHDCDSQAIPRIFLETMVLQTITGELLTIDNLSSLQTLVEQTENQRQAELARQAGALRAQLGAIRRRIGNITDNLAEEGRSRALLKKLTELETEETDLLSQLTRLEERAREKVAALEKSQLTGMLDRLRSDLASGDPERIRRTLCGMIERITVERDGNTVRAKFDYYYPPEEHPPPNNGIMPMYPAPLGAPPHRHTFIHSTTWQWTRKKRTI